jgi:hypothetical protein
VINKQNRDNQKQEEFERSPSSCVLCLYPQQLRRRAYFLNFFLILFCADKHILKFSAKTARYVAIFIRDRSNIFSFVIEGPHWRAQQS